MIPSQTAQAEICMHRERLVNGHSRKFDGSLSQIRARVLTSPASTQRLAMRRFSKAGPHYFSQSAHFGGSPEVPHGMIGTDDVEFLGEPSTSLSE